MTEAISVVGLGKLGLGLALSFADAGFPTLGVDVIEQNVRQLRRRRSPIVEPDYQEVLERVGPTFAATLDHRIAIDETNITFILVGTPSDASGRFSSRDVEAAARALGQALKESDKPHHLFVVSSTLVPGTVEGTIIPIIEAASGRTLNAGFSVCYDPDFVALGSVFHDFTHPDLVVIGESTPDAGARVEAIHHRMAKTRPVISRMPIVSAEIAKVSLNAFITLKITFANAVANLCESIPGADADAVTRAIGADRRISPHYFKGGLAFGGTCFPRDTHAFRAVCEQFGEDASLMGTVAALNDRQNQRLVEAACAHARPGLPVAVLGLAFKNNTPVIEASPGVALVDGLLAAGCRVRVYDRLALPAARIRYQQRVEYADALAQAVDGAGLVVLTLPDREMATLLDAWAPARPVTILDCWRMLDERALAPQVTRVALGRVNARIPAAKVA